MSCVHMMQEAERLRKFKREARKSENYEILYRKNPMGKFIDGFVVDATDVNKIQEVATMLKGWHPKEDGAILQFDLIDDLRRGMGLKPIYGEINLPKYPFKVLEVPDAREYDHDYAAFKGAESVDEEMQVDISHLLKHKEEYFKRAYTREEKISKKDKKELDLILEKADELKRLDSFIASRDGPKITITPPTGWDNPKDFWSDPNYIPPPPTKDKDGEGLMDGMAMVANVGEIRWRTRDGRVMKLKEMTPSHLKNAYIKMNNEGRRSATEVLAQELDRRRQLEALQIMRGDGK